MQLWKSLSPKFGRQVVLQLHLSIHPSMILIGNIQVFPHAMQLIFCTAKALSVHICLALNSFVLFILIPLEA